VEDLLHRQLFPQEAVSICFSQATTRNRIMDLSLTTHFTLCPNSANQARSGVGIVIVSPSLGFVTNMTIAGMELTNRNANTI